MLDDQQPATSPTPVDTEAPVTPPYEPRDSYDLIREPNTGFGAWA
jgi:hypothetical protein